MDTVPGTESGKVTVETISIYADLSIRRACGFALLGIGCVMFGFSYDLLLSFRAGTILVALVGAILYYKHLHAPMRNYANTELWIMLPERPKGERADLQRLIGGVLADRYLWHTKAAAGLAAAFAAISLLIRLGRL